jgi:hypothetical protein
MAGTLRRLFIAGEASITPESAPFTAMPMGPPGLLLPCAYGIGRFRIMSADVPTPSQGGKCENPVTGIRRRHLAAMAFGAGAD